MAYFLLELGTLEIDTKRSQAKHPVHLRAGIAAVRNSFSVRNLRRSFRRLRNLRWTACRKPNIPLHLAEKIPHAREGEGLAPPPLLSVAIITANEDPNLARTLRSVAFAAEIVIVDSGSTDRTADIAHSFGAQFFVEPWKGFAAQKNSALRKCTGTWILSLDADEELSPELALELQTLLASKPSVDAFRLRRRNLFLDRWIRHGGFYPDAKLRLFRRGTAEITFSDRPVHETLSVSGPTATLSADLIHHAYPTLGSYLEHMNRYSSLGADLLVARRRTSRSLLAFVWNVVYVPQLTFVWNYIVRLGFLDGREGLLLHLYHSVYVSWKYSKAWHLARSTSNTHPEANPSLDSQETSPPR